MEYRRLGGTALEVSRIAFGTIPFKIRDTSPEDGAELLVFAREQGINFFDLAEIYCTYPHMRAALPRMEQPVIIASRSQAKTADAMDTSIKLALDEIGIERLDLFQMHGVDTLDDLRERRPAWDALLAAKSAGLVRAVGFSTHSCPVMREIIGWPDVEVILAGLNREGVGILDGTMDEMRELIALGAERGKGVYGMKVFAGGNLFAEARAALDYGLTMPGVDCLAVGMQNRDEIVFNCAVASGQPVPPEVLSALETRKRELHVRPFCKACGVCVDACRYGALAMGEKLPVVDETKCILCGYCGFACPSMAIKIV